MAPPSLSAVFAIGVDILKTVTDATSNTILAQTGDAVTGTVDSNNVEWWQHVGFASRPSPPTVGVPGCQGVLVRRSDQNACIASRDVRYQQVWGNVKDGETFLYATGKDGNAQGRVAIKQDGSITMYTTDSNTASGNACYLRNSPTKGLQYVAPWGSMRFDQTGFHVMTSSGARLDLGGIYGLPSPLSSLTTYAKIGAGIVKADGTLVLLGPDNPAQIWFPAAYGPDPAPAPLTLTGIKSMTVKMAP